MSSFDSYKSFLWLKIIGLAALIENLVSFADDLFTFTVLFALL